MNRTERHRLILAALAERGTVDVDDLVLALGVSPATVRRDLTALHDERLLERSHGGAHAIEALYELPVRYRGSLNRDQKWRIAQAAAALVSDGASIALSGGTTTTEVGRALARLQGLTVVTNAINIAAELAIRPDIRLIVTGGFARSASYELVGPLADQALSQLHVDIAFLGVDGIDAAGGLTTHRDVEAQTNRMMLQRAARVVVVADGSKVGVSALARITDVTAVSTLITTNDAPTEALRRIESAGVTVDIV